MVIDPWSTTDVIGRRLVIDNPRLILSIVSSLIKSRRWNSIPLIHNRRYLAPIIATGLRCDQSSNNSASYESASFTVGTSWRYRSSYASYCYSSNQNLFCDRNHLRVLSLPEWGADLLDKKTSSPIRLHTLISFVKYLLETVL